MWRCLSLLCGVFIATGAYASVTPDRVLDHIDRKTVIPLVQHEASRDRRQTLCLALGLYHEARGESAAGQRAVGHVILNRVHATGESVCHTLWTPGNFQWTKRSVRHLIPHEEAAWIAAQWQAMVVWADPDNTQGATMFYNSHLCRPRWANKGIVTARFGNHVFIRS